MGKANVTTFIVDDHSAACDSLWSNQHGRPVQSTLYKYLFVPEDNMIKPGEPAYAIYYAGSAETILLHQAFITGMLTGDQYMVWSGNLKLVRPDVSLGFCHVQLHPWVPLEYENIGHDQGFMFGGSGGSHAQGHYRDNYCTEAATVHAISKDAASGPPVVHYCSKEKTQKNLKVLDESLRDVIYEHTANLISDLDAYKAMKDFKYSGCSTAAADEAPPVDLDKLGRWVERHEQSRKKQHLRDVVSGKACGTKLKPRRLFEGDDEGQGPAPLKMT